MPIDNLVWVLPRPKRNKYKGGFPLWFEEKLLTLYGFDYKTSDLKDKVLHMFAGMSKFGFRVDIKPEVEPDLIADCHNLPISDNTYDMVICDPPYSDELSKELYGTGKIKYKQYISEAVRIVKPGGFVASYHWAMTPRPEGTNYHKRIFIGTRIWHKPRICCIFQKEYDDDVKTEERRKNMQSVQQTL
jgi:hypothetical protein